MAWYPAFNSGSRASWLHTADTCSFTSMKKLFSMSCHNGNKHEKLEARDGPIRGSQKERARPGGGGGEPGRRRRAGEVRSQAAWIKAESRSEYLTEMTQLEL